MQRIRGRLTYANVVATVALFVAVGGASAFAAGRLARNSVGPRQLKAGAVDTAKIRNGAVTAAKIRDGAVAGGKVDASSLGKVPSASFAAAAGDAQTLGGNPATAFARGSAQILSGRVDLQLGEERLLLSIPGVGPLHASCKAGVKNPVIEASLTNASGATFDQTLEYNKGVDSGIFANGKSVEVSEEELLVDRMKVATRTSPAIVATVDVSGRSENTPTACAAYAQAIVSR